MPLGNRSVVSNCVSVDCHGSKTSLKHPLAKLQFYFHVLHVELLHRFSFSLFFFFNNGPTA